MDKDEEDVNEGERREEGGGMCVYGKQVDGEGERGIY